MGAREDVAETVVDEGNKVLLATVVLLDEDYHCTQHCFLTVL